MKSPLQTPLLSAAEALVLLDPNKAQGREAFKLALTELLARKSILLRHEEQKGFLGRVKKNDYLQLAPNAYAQFPSSSPLAVVLTNLQDWGASGPGLPMQQLAYEAHKKYGNDLAYFSKNYLLPGLITRGLLESRQEKRLLLFTVTRYHHTLTGELLRQQMTSQIAQAQTLPTIMETDPTQAAALVIGLGSAIFLVEDIKSHYERLSKILHEQQTGGDYLDFSPTWSDSSSIEVPDLNLLDGGLFDVDFNFDGLDAALDAFDNSFDFSSDSISDGGSDSGGGE